MAEGFPVTGYQFQHNFHAPLRCQAEIIIPLGPVALGMAGEFADDAFHRSLFYPFR